MTRIATLLPAVLFAASGAGGAASGEAADGSGSALPPGIDWFDGSVDDAFSAAAEAGKPVYLYWGAEWCPPCHAIKATVFRSPEFIERSSLFVPVYLDGDDEHAQAAGQRFGVLGYPTMIVFDAAGNELTRIPGGIDLEAYANVLDLTLSNAASTRELVRDALRTDSPLAPAQCARLAYYSWQQDPAMFAILDSGETLRSLWALCPRDLERERARLYSAWLEARIAAAENEEEPPAFTADEAAEAFAFLERVLDSRQLARDNVLLINTRGPQLVAAVTAAGSERREALVRRFDAAYDRLFADDGLYKRERIYTLLGKIGFERIDDADAPLSAALEREIRRAAAWADRSTPEPYARQPIVNAMANVLGAAGMNDLRRELLLAELEVSKQPYYFMPDLADIEQQAGNYGRALAWLERGWNEATGAATRFQWALYYLTGLLEMTPDDADTIRATTVGMIAELQAGGGFYHRPRAQLEQLEDALSEWSEAHGSAALLGEIRTAVLALCPADTQADSRQVCEEFLEAA